MTVLIGGWHHGLRAVRPSAVPRHIERQRAIAHLRQPLPAPDLDALHARRQPADFFNAVITPVTTHTAVLSDADVQAIRALTSPDVTPPVVETKTARRRPRKAKVRTA